MPLKVLFTISTPFVWYGKIGQAAQALVGHSLSEIMKLRRINHYYNILLKHLLNKTWRTN
jgi:hypothetical protein